MEKITREDFLKAKEIIAEYEKQQQIEDEIQKQMKIKRFESGDLDLLTVLPTKSRNFLITHNESEYTKDGDELIYISDIVKMIKKSGNDYALLKMRGCGKKRYDEIMSYVKPFL